MFVINYLFYTSHVGTVLTLIWVFCFDNDDKDNDVWLLKEKNLKDIIDTGRISIQFID